MRIVYIISIFLISVFIYSCAVFEEKPVTNEIITITSPGNLTTITSLNVTFIWSEVQNSAPFKYNIQVASPDFIAPSNFLIDTNTTLNKYTKTLSPGQYACRVRVFNGNTQSQYTTINFVLDTNKQITGTFSLSAPADGFKSKSKTVSLAWNNVSNAANYSIQVFLVDSLGNLIERKLDTTITATKVTFRGDPGLYSWQVRAFNNGSTTDYIIRKFSIDTLNSISDETAVLLSPSDNIYLNVNKISFQWQNIPYATAYKLEIANNDFNLASNIFYSVSAITKDTITTSIKFDGKYQWRITASNIGGNANTSVARTFTIITKTPTTPELIEPIQNMTVTNNIVNFSWSKDQNTLDSLIILESDSLTRYKSIGQFSNSGVSTYDLLFDPGWYFWKVESTDLAGNTSHYSTLRKFYVP